MLDAKELDRIRKKLKKEQDEVSRRAEEQRKEQRKQETQEAAEAVAAEAQKAPDVADQAAQLVQFANQVRRPRERVVRNRLALFTCEINLLISRAKRTRSQRLKSTHPLSDAMFSACRSRYVFGVS